MNEPTFYQPNKHDNDIKNFKLYYTEYKKHVFAMAFSILRDFELSEDVLQEVFIKLFQYQKRNKIANVKAWLIRVARNTALDMYRKKHREVSGFTDDYFERMQYHTEDPVEKIILTKYIEILDQDERQIIILKDIAGMKHREIAEVVKMPLGTVLWKYRTAINKLRKNIE